MLSDPFEKQLDPPARKEQIGDSLSLHAGVRPAFHILDADAPQRAFTKKRHRLFACAT
jgi:hypothetical protein